MTEVSHDDASLLARARQTEPDAVAELYKRHYPGAVRYARTMADDSSVDDLVSDAFLKVFRQLAAGGGPETNFKAYLNATLRNLRVDSLRSSGRSLPLSPEDMPEPEALPASFEWEENEILMRALKRLPAHHRQVLWWGEVLELPHQDIADRLGSNPNAIGVLKFRAREALREAYLAVHLSAAEEQPECTATLASLPRYVRGTLPRTKSARVAAHLDGCRSCSQALAVLDNENRKLAALLLPALALVMGSHSEDQGRSQEATRSTAAVAVAAVVAVVGIATAVVAGVAGLPTNVGSVPRSGEESTMTMDGPSGAELSPSAPQGSASKLPSPSVPSFATQPSGLVSPGSAPDLASPPDASPSALPTSSPSVLPPTLTLTALPTLTPTALPTLTPTALPTLPPTAVPTSNPTQEVGTPSTVSWSQLPVGTPLRGASLVADQTGPAAPLVLTPSVVVDGQEAADYNFRVGHQALQGPVSLAGMSAQNAGMILNLYGGNSSEVVTFDFSRPVTRIEFDVYNFTRTNVDNPNGYNKSLSFSENVSLGGDTTLLNSTSGTGPFWRTAEYMTAGTMRVTSDFQPTTSFSIDFGSRGPTDAQVWFAIGVGDLQVTEAP